MYQIWNIALAVTSLSFVACQSEKKEKDQKPNIIYILADDMGYGDLSINGQKHFQTPNLDQLAKDGIRFTNHYSGSTVCAPSRCCLLTGKHTGHATIRQNYSVKTRERIGLNDEDVTIAEILKQEGYVTGATGKWGLGEIGSKGTPCKQGFDYWYGYINQHNAHFYYPEFLYENNHRVDLEGNLNGNKTQYSHDLIMDKSFDFIRKNHNKPFFLYLAVTLPHAELLLPDSYIQEFRGKYPEKEFINKKEGGYNSQKTPRAAFAAMMKRFDGDVGDLCTLLSQLGIADNTIIMFASDNGAHKEGGADPEFFNSNGPFKGIKRDVYEGGIRTPFFVAWPQKIKKGMVSDHISAFWDVLPTIINIVGAKETSKGDGISFYNTLIGKEQEKHSHLYWEFVRKGEVRQAVRMDKWKAVRYGLNNELELYDLSTDEGENHNVAKDYPGIVEKMKQKMLESHVDSEDFPLKIIN